MDQNQAIVDIHGSRIQLQGRWYQLERYSQVKKCVMAYGAGYVQSSHVQGITRFTVRLHHPEKSAARHVQGRYYQNTRTHACK